MNQLESYASIKDLLKNYLPTLLLLENNARRKIKKNKKNYGRRAFTKDAESVSKESLKLLFLYAPLDS